MSLGREQLPWSNDIWSSIDSAVNAEVQRTCVAAKIIPLHAPAPSPDVPTVPADIIDSATMTVDESAVTPIVELGVEFRLTRQQIGNEADVGTAVSLATRAANGAPLAQLWQRPAILRRRGPGRAVQRVPLVVPARDL